MSAKKPTANLRDSAQQALEALEIAMKTPINEYLPREPLDAINALRAALADTQDWDEIKALRASLREHMAEIHRLRAAGRQALDTLERAGEQLRWQSIGQAQHDLRAALAEPVQEPGCHVFNVTVTGRLHEWEPTTFAFALRDGKHALYTAPPKRKPLTDEQITELFHGNNEQWWRVDHSEFCPIARAIERAHGIGGEE